MKKIKPLFLVLHRWLGLLSGLVVFIVAITGCLYVFEEEWREAFQYHYFHVKAQDTPRLPFTQLIGVVKEAYPKEKITSIRFLEAKDAAIVFHTKKELAVSVNPYTAQIIGTRDLNRDFMSVVLDIHRHLFMGEFGKEVVKWNVLIFFLMCVSGLVLWWPKQKRFLKQAVTIKWKTKNWKRFNWDLHSVLGFYALFVLFTISLTGMFWAFDSVKSLVGLATGSPVWEQKKVKSIPAVLQKKNPIDSAYYYASLQNPGARQVFITPPADSTAPIQVRMRYPYTLVRRQSTAFFDQYSLRHLHTDAYQSYTRYEYISRSVYDFHTGRIRFLGIGSKIIYFLASLFAASLPVTGFLIWWGRNHKKKLARKKGPAKRQKAIAVKETSTTVL